MTTPSVGTLDHETRGLRHTFQRFVVQRQVMFLIPTGGTLPWMHAVAAGITYHVVTCGAGPIRGGRSDFKTNRAGEDFL